MIRVRAANSIFANRTETAWIQTPGDVLLAYLPDWADEYTTVRVDGWKIDRSQWLSYRPADGSYIAVVRSPQVTGILIAAGVSVVVATIVGVVVNIALAIAAAYLARKLAGSPKETVRIESPTYSWSGLQTTTRQGQPIPIVYGNHRISGQVIAVTVDTLPGSGGPERSVLRVLLACGEGPFHSIAGITRDRNINVGPDISSEVKLNGNPISNIPGVQMYVRLGNSRQSPAPGFEGVTSVQQVGQELVQGSTQTFTTLDPADEFRAALLFPNGLFYTSDEGKFRALSVEIVMRWRVSGATDWVEEESNIITAGVSGQFRHILRKPLPEAYQNQVIEVQLEKISDFPAPQFQDTVQWETLTEIRENESLTYPMTALIGFEIEASANVQGGTPTFTFPVQGKKVWVWDGVDPDDPTWSYEFSTNPAWCLLDLILNKRYGNGWAYNLCNIDLQSFGDWADYCDELIDDLSGTSTTMKRWELGLVIDTQRPFWDQVNQIAAAGRAAIVKVGDTIKVKIDRAADPVAIFSMGNIIAGTLSIDYGSTARRPASVGVQFLNEDQDYVIDVAEENDDSVLDSVRPVQRKETVSIFGITKKARALRAARYIINQNRLIDMTATFEAGPDSLTVEPGDVIGIQHEMIDWDGAIGGRVRSATSTSVTLDRDIVVTAGQTWVIQVRTDDTGADVIQERTLIVDPGTITAGTAIPINTAWDGGDTPDQYDVYAVAPTSSPTRLFKVVQRELGQNLQVKFTCVKYVAAVYDDTPTSGINEDEIDEPIDENTIPPAPFNLVLQEQVSTETGETALYVSWEREPWPYSHPFQVYLREDGDTNYILQATVNSTTHLLENVDAGTTYCVAINSVAPSGAHRAAGEDAVDCIALTGVAPPPADMSTATASQNSDTVSITWAEISDSSLSHYEIRRGSYWTHGRIVGTATAPPFTTQDWAVGDETWLVRAVNFAGRVSGRPAAVDITLAVPDGHATDLSRDEVSLGWPGTKSSTQVDGDGNLELTAAATSGTYTSPTIDLSSVASRRVGILIGSTHDEPTRTWDALDTTWDEATQTWDAAIETWDEQSVTWDSEDAETHDWQGSIYSPESSVVLESRRSDDAVTWSAWATHSPGTYSFRYLEFRLTLTRSDATNYTADVNELLVTVSS